ncbi:MAG: S-layer homology domain-containing protein [Bacillota bacterium]
MKKKMASSLLALSLLVTPFAGQKVGAAEYKDTFTYYEPVDIEKHWSENNLREMLYADIVRGTIVEEDLGDGLYIENLYMLPDEKITRAEFVTFIVRALELKATNKTVPFKDISNHWGVKDIKIAYQNGIVNGTTKTSFSPKDKITRAEMAAMIVRAFDKTVEFENGKPKDYKDLKKSHWAYNDLRKVNGMGIINGLKVDQLAPNADGTRAQSIVMIHRALKNETTNLPTKEMLETIILNNELKGLEYLNKKDYNALKNLVDVRQMGFAHSFSHLGIEELLEAGEVTISGKLKGDIHINYEDAELNTRLVKIELADAIYDMKQTYEGETKEYEKDASGYVYLRLEGQRWKLYTSEELERQYNE